MPLTLTSTPTPDSVYRRRLIVAIQIGSLVVTGWLVRMMSAVADLHDLNLANLLWQMAGYTLLAWVTSSLVAFGLYGLAPLEDRLEMVPTVLRTASTAIWLGPTMLLLAELSPAAFPAALVLVVYSSILLYSQWCQPLEEAAKPPVELRPWEPGAFADFQQPTPAVWGGRLREMALAVCLQGTAVALAAHYPLLGAVGLCLGTALFTICCMTAGTARALRPLTLARSLSGVLAITLLAAFLVLGRDSAGSGAIGGGGSLAETARALMGKFFGVESGHRSEKGTSVADHLASDAGRFASGGIPGLILFPEHQPVATILAPIMPRVGSGFPGRMARPLTIPFSGVYWVFRWPYTQPPALSSVQRGDPTKRTFSTTDRQPLQMEAQHKLEAPMSLQCCSEIRIEAINADRYPDTLALQLLLRDTRHAPEREIFLGEVPVRSHPDLGRNPIVGVQETLSFSVPSQPPSRSSTNSEW